MMMKQYISLALLILITACTNQPAPTLPTATPTVIPPATAVISTQAGDFTPPQQLVIDRPISFLADPATVSDGGCTTLRWDISGDISEARIEWPGGYYPVDIRQGGIKDCPTENQTYTLTVQWGDGVQDSRTATVTANDTGASAIYGERTVDLYVDPTTITVGTCATINWAIRGDFVKVELSWAEGNYQIESAYGYFTDCPKASQTYRLFVEWRDGTSESQSADLTVE